MRHTPLLLDPAVPALPRPLRRLRRLVAGTAGLLLAGSVVVTSGSHGSSYGDPERAAASSGPRLTLVAHHTRPSSHRWPGHPGRYVKAYRVHRGDTATGLAVRFHAWTDELLAINHLSRHATLYAGERIRIPVVVAAARKARAHRHHATRRPKHTTHHAKHVTHHAKHTSHHTKHATHHSTTSHGWVYADVSRATVRRVIVRTALDRRVSPSLALAIGWQESGWQQRRVSSAGALGVMQVMPGTGRGLSRQVHRTLNLRDLHDNVTAGVLLLRELDAHHSDRYVVAGYYQGIGSVSSRGMYPSTRAYVRSVLGIRERLLAGWDPAH